MLPKMKILPTKDVFHKEAHPYVQTIAVESGEMINFLELSPILLTGGSPTVRELRDLHSIGCEVVINLALPGSDGAIPDEAGEVTALGMEYIPIPVVWEAPTADDLTRFFDVMDRCQGRKTFVHCVKNMRVSAFLYLYRLVRLNWDPALARRDLIKIWEPSGIWAEFIDNMLTK